MCLVPVGTQASELFVVEDRAYLLWLLASEVIVIGGEMWTQYCVYMYCNTCHGWPVHCRYYMNLLWCYVHTGVANSATRDILLTLPRDDIVVEHSEF